LLPIVSNGDPSASVVIDLAVWLGSTPSTLRPVDFREYVVQDLPTDQFVELVVTFGTECETKTGLKGRQAYSLCLTGETCDATQDGKCVNNVINATALLPYPADGGAAVIAMDAGADGTLHDGVAPDGPADGPADAEAPADATLGEENAADANEAADAANPVVELEASLPGPCAPACQEGITHCIDSTCVPVPPSCAGGGAGAGFNCGGAIDNTDDCCNWFDVSGGSFYRDYDGLYSLDMSNPASVSTFGLDVYEVTVGRYRKFVNAIVGSDAAPPWTLAPGAGRHRELRDGGGLITGGNVTGADGGVVYEPGWDPSWNSYIPTTKADWDSSLTAPGCSNPGPSLATWTPDPGLYENLPINCVTWYQAYAFCIWDGGFLPSSTEWNRAAAPPFSTGQRVYAWGNKDPDYSNRYAIWNWSYPGNSLTVSPASVNNIAPVGTPQLGKALWGQFDLTGSMFEWTLDYETDPLTLRNPCVDCADTQAGTQRAFRGGGFDSVNSPSNPQLQSAYHMLSPPASPHADVGVRCARPPYGP
jgi:formylglycine-generating enzyme required for sulfatase activity